MTNYYYVDGSGQQQGPVTAAALRSLNLRAGTMVWREGLAEWQPIESLAEFRDLVPEQAPPPLPVDQAADPFMVSGKDSGYSGGYAGPRSSGNPIRPGYSLNIPNAYDQSFDTGSLSQAEFDYASNHQFSSEFPVWVAILLHYISFGIFTMVRLGIDHGQLPLVKDNDFGTGKAIGFLFIPFYNFYWIFMFYVRLAKRMNFQFKLRGMQGPVPEGLAMARCILTFIPYIGYLNFLILSPIILGIQQAAVNRLVRLREQEKMGFGG